MTAFPNAVPDETEHPHPARDTGSDDGHTELLDDPPITVWRLDDRIDPTLADTDDRHLPPRLAQRLISVYTRHGDAVVDLDGDQRLRTAAADASRAYCAITNSDDLCSACGRVALMVMRWPRDRAAHAVASTVLPAACRLIMTSETCAIVAMTGIGSERCETTYGQHLRQLQSAVTAAGFKIVLRILAIMAPTECDRFVFYASPREAKSFAEVASTEDDPPRRIELLVISIARARHE